MQSQLFIKPAHSSTCAPWHQDGKEGVSQMSSALFDSYKPVALPLAVLWIPLDDVDCANGGLRVIPRLHTLGVLPVGLSHSVIHPTISCAHICAS
jgi:ectoine hydroxylase-related dioxygenase (phytanoyl-CoA dioxygenase family)